MAPTRRAFDEYTPWSRDEDNTLRALVAEYGTARGKDSRWQELAEQLPGRSAKNCRKRWFYSLDPTVKRSTPWSPDEDARLHALMTVHGKLWWRIARDMDGRTDDQCAARYHNVLSVTDRPWSEEEDKELLVFQARVGNKWKEIATHFEGRSALSCRNRCRKFLSRANASASQPSRPRRQRSESLRNESTGRSNSTSSSSSASSSSLSTAGPPTPGEAEPEQRGRSGSPLDAQPAIDAASSSTREGCDPGQTPDQHALPQGLQDMWTAGGSGASFASSNPPPTDSMFAALASAALAGTMTQRTDQPPAPLTGAMSATPNQGPLAALVQALASPQGMSAGGVAALGSLGLGLPPPSAPSHLGAFGPGSAPSMLGMPSLQGMTGHVPFENGGVAAGLAALLAVSQMAPQPYQPPAADPATWQALLELVRRIVPDAGRAQIAVDLIRHLATLP